MFNSYINSLFGFNSGGEIIEFADNTIVLYRYKTKTESDRWLEDIDEVVSIGELPWTARKLNSYHFRPTSWDNQYLKIEKQHIPQTKSTKYLGIVIDEHLKWDMHATYILLIWQKKWEIFWVNLCT